MNPRMHVIIEYGPLGVFFATYWIAGIFAATAAIMVATVTALAIAWVTERRIPKVPLVSGVLLMVFGGLTLWFQNETFLKMKPTIIYVLFAAVLIGAVALRRSPLKALLGHALELDDKGWTSLTVRFGLFFLVMAGLNELVWRTQSTDFWVNYKVFGSIGLMFLFFILQAPLIQRHQLSGDEPPSQ